MKSLTIRYVFLTSAVFLLLTSFSCESSKMTSDSTVPAPPEVSTSETGSLNQISISFSGMSGYVQHQIKQNQIISSEKGRGDNNGETIKKVSDKNWKNLNDLVSQLDLNKVETWESPTQERFHDGARATIITIESNGQSYTSQAFDEGNPPAALKDLYDYLAKLTQS